MRKKRFLNRNFCGIKVTLNNQRKHSKNKLKLLFFLMIVPVIILGEFIKILHRVGPYSIQQVGLDVKQGYIRTRDSKQISIKYTKNYDRCVILVHGYLSSSKRSILKYSENLSKNKIDFVAIDFRNHGQSSLSLPISAGFYEKLDMIAVMKWVKREWNQYHILSTSMGSYTTIYASSELDQKYQPKSIILESFGVDIKLGTRDTLTLIYKFPYLLSSLVTSYAHLRSPYMFERDVRKDIQKIKVPMLIAHGGKDRIYSSITIQAILKKILPSKTQYITIARSGHSELWRAKQFQNLIIEFFNK